MSSEPRQTKGHKMIIQINRTQLAKAAYEIARAYNELVSFKEQPCWEKASYQQKDDAVASAGFYTDYPDATVAQCSNMIAAQHIVRGQTNGVQETTYMHIFRAAVIQLCKLRTEKAEYNSSADKNVMNFHKIREESQTLKETFHQIQVLIAKALAKKAE